MTTHSRRSFLRNGLLLAGAAGVGWGALHQLRSRRMPARPHPGLGPLNPVRDATTGLPILMLPAGFRYHTFGWAGDIQSDGYAGARRADGMGVVGFENGRVVLVRNQEQRGSGGAIGNPATAYDNTGGGTTTLVFDTQREVLAESFFSLNGTLNNCAGGVTPWNTWLSCEEAAFSPELLHLGMQSRQAFWNIENAGRRHGYVFEVDTRGTQDPQPLTAMGQFYHEAVAFDVETGHVFQTEDRWPDAGLYRFIPEVTDDLSRGGRLQMLRVGGHAELKDTVRLFEAMSTDWVDIEDPERGHTPGTHDGAGVVNQGVEAGATAFRSLEGCIVEGRDLFFTSKNGGRLGTGMVFHLDLDSGELQAIWEATQPGGLAGPDNIVVSPRGSLMICEDNETETNQGQQVTALDRSGALYSVCRTNPALQGSWLGHDLAQTVSTEWAGVCFSPDGQWMFANLYQPGFTCAITGPWDRGPV